MRNFVTVSLCIIMWIVYVVNINAEEARWMPDPNLRKSVREKIRLPDNKPLKQEHLKWLTALDISNSGISDLTGLRACYLFRMDLCMR